MSTHREFLAFMDTLATRDDRTSQAAVTEALKLWHRLREELPGQVSLPITQACDDGTVQFAWRTLRFALSVDVDAAGNYEWFGRESESDTYWGDDTKAGETFPTRLAPALALLAADRDAGP